MGRDSSAVWMPSPNFSGGRNGYSPKWLILHGTAGGGALSWFANPQSQVSSHYVITVNGTVYQCVDENNMAWANGPISVGHDPWWSPAINPNWQTISIEHEKLDTANASALTAAQKASGFALVKRICERRGIPMRPADAAGGITGHFSMDPINRSRCPGNYPWHDLWVFLGALAPEPAGQEGELPMLTLTDPFASENFTDIGGGRWHCKATNVDLIGANLDFYRKYNGIFGLPLTNEIYLGQLPHTALVVYERAIAIYDPNRTLDKAPYDDPCYLIHLDKGIGQQLIAKALTQAIQAQLDTASKQLADTLTQNATLTQQVQQLGQTNAALQQQVSTLQGQVQTPPPPPSPDLVGQCAALSLAIEQIRAIVAPFSQKATQ